MKKTDTYCCYDIMKTIETLQNLILMAASDGQISDHEKIMIYGYSEEMDLSMEEANRLMKNVSSLPYIVPELEEQKKVELFKLTLIALTDRKLSDEEFSALQYYAALCNLPHQVLLGFIEQITDKFNETEERWIVEENHAQYDAVLNTIRKSGLKDREIAGLLHQVSKTKNLQTTFSQETDVNDGFYRFLWLMYHRYVKLDHTGITMVKMQLELAKLGEYTLDDIVYDFKLSEEAFFDGKALELDKKELSEIKDELAKDFPFASN